ncbi:MAG: flap endonuclease-1 [Candidatus Freyarchaeota archaeon]
MGVRLASIVRFKTISLDELKNTRVAVDASNMLFQFLNKIRGRNLPLFNREGRVVSHIYGAFYRTINLLEHGIKPIYVFDGPHPRLKNRRKHLAESLIREYGYLRKARESKNYTVARTLSLTYEVLYDTIIDETRRLLTLMGVPWVRAPGEGEAQAAYMTRVGKADHVLTQDYDALLFGARSVLRNLSFTENSVQCATLEDVLRVNGISYEGLVDLAILVGTDFNPGVRGVGVKRGLKLIRKHGSITNMFSSGELEPFDVEEVRRVFLSPDVVDARILFNAPNTSSLRRLLEEFGMKPERIDRGIRRLVRAYKESRRIQTTLKPALDVFGSRVTMKSDCRS